jgi:cell division protein ZapB
MDQELFSTLEQKIDRLVDRYTALQAEHARLVEENRRLQADREGLKTRIDAILSRLEGF